jgi:hypothetical protein
MILLPDHLIGHGLRDSVVYGGDGIAMLAGFALYISGRSERLRRDENASSTEESTAPATDEPLIRERDKL